MVIDSSALCAIVLEEADASIYVSAILNDRVRFISAATLVEISLVAVRRRTANAVAVVDGLVARMNIVVIPVDHEQALLAREAFLRFGKGQDRAGLNFGDCFSYALAKQTSQPLLFKGNEFALTDIVRA
jgi:ribonuclease VapC